MRGPETFRTKFGVEVVFRYELCIICQGSGKFDDEECQACTGKGDILMASSLRTASHKIQEHTGLLWTAMQHMKRAASICREPNVTDQIWEQFSFMTLGKGEPMKEIKWHLIEVDYIHDRDTIGVYADTVDGKRSLGEPKLMTGGVIGFIYPKDGKFDKAKLTKLIEASAENCDEKLVSMTETYEEALDAQGKLNDLAKEAAYLRRKTQEIMAPEPKRERKKRKRKGCTTPHCQKPSHVWDDKGRPWCKRHGYAKGLLIHEKVNQEEKDSA